MTKKKKRVTEDNPVQSHAFRRAVADLEAAGALNRTEADEAFEKAMDAVVEHKPKAEG